MKAANLYRFALRTAKKSAPSQETLQYRLWFAYTVRNLITNNKNLDPSKSIEMVRNGFEDVATIGRVFESLEVDETAQYKRRIARFNNGAEGWRGWVPGVAITKWTKKMATSVGLHRRF
jgi:hypothetical protein